MPQFWEISENKIYSMYETDKLGFPSNAPCYIPQEYLDQRKFVLFRTCHSLGDWGIISAMPRLLKQKYPDCKVYIPSAKLLEDMFGQQGWQQWNNAYKNPGFVFANNPYIDGELDFISGEVFHDHYRIYDPINSEISLVIQMLRFWRFEPNEIKDDYLPEFYFSDEEIKQGDDIIQRYMGDNEFWALMLASTTLNRDEKKERGLVTTHIPRNMLCFSWGYDKTFEEITPNIYDFKELNVPLRVQLYIRTKAAVNLGYETGLTTCLSRYSNIISAIKRERINSNYFYNIQYLRY